jgi:hypothetical protein
MPEILSAPLTLLAMVVVALIIARALGGPPALHAPTWLAGRFPRLRAWWGAWGVVVLCALLGGQVFGFVSRDILGASHAVVRIVGFTGLVLGGLVGFLGRGGTEGSTAVQPTPTDLPAKTDSNPTIRPD